MRPMMIAILLLASCGVAEPPVTTETGGSVLPAAADSIIDDTSVPAAIDSKMTTASGQSEWDMQSSGEGSALVVSGDAGQTLIRLFCPASTGQLLVNVPAFEPISSEDRLSFGQGGEAEALVADTGGDAERGGVTAVGPIPTNLVSLLSGSVSASYGAQVSGPHTPPPADLKSAFVAACAEAASDASKRSPEKTASTGNSNAGASACLRQDGRAIPANTLRAVGTEPFWSARVEGRCVTYSHPENQSGTRVWTKFSGSEENGLWSGALDGQPFVMRTTPKIGCSDGMSDGRYTIAVSLTVGGEKRSGCAVPF